jgi:hypothetical protein
MDFLISIYICSEQPTPEDLLSEKTTQQAESTQSYKDTIFGISIINLQLLWKDLGKMLV